jgi:hypothetical protein
MEVVIRKDNIASEVVIKEKKWGNLDLEIISYF